MNSIISPIFENKLICMYHFCPFSVMLRDPRCRHPVDIKFWRQLPLTPLAMIPRSMPRPSLTAPDWILTNTGLEIPRHGLVLTSSSKFCCFFSPIRFFNSRSWLDFANSITLRFAKHFASVIDRTRPHWDRVIPGQRADLIECFKKLILTSRASLIPTSIVVIL